MTTGKLMFAALLLLYAMTGLFYVFFGSLHLDEASYLYASRDVMSGAVPYRDFFYLQPPLHPYLYGLFQSIHPGLLTGRLTSFGLGFLTLILISQIAYRLGGGVARLIFVLLMAATPFQIYFNSITRLYALSGFWIALGLLFLTKEPHPGIRQSLPGLLCLALAVGTRLTLLPVLVIAGFYILLNSRSMASRIVSLSGAGAVLVGVFLPFYILAGPPGSRQPVQPGDWLWRSGVAPGGREAKQQPVK